MKKIKIIIADDHKLFRDGLRYILGETDNIEVLSEVSNGKELLEILEVAQPDVVLLDINMPVMNGIDAAREAMSLYPGLKILVLTMYDDEQYYNSLIEIGVKGFVLKDTDSKELKNAIVAVATGNSYFSQELLLKLIRKKKSKEEVEEGLKLTRREREILMLICKGLSNAEISDLLHLSQRTVERHRASLLAKTNTHNSIAMVLYAIKHGLVEI